MSECCGDQSCDPYIRFPKATLEAVLRRAEVAAEKKPGAWCVDDYIVTPGDTPNQWHVYECGEDDPPLATCYGGWEEVVARYIAAADPTLIANLIRELLDRRANHVPEES